MKNIYVIHRFEEINTHSCDIAFVLSYCRRTHGPVVLTLCDVRTETCTSTVALCVGRRACAAGMRRKKSGWRYADEWVRNAVSKYIYLVFLEERRGLLSCSIYAWRKEDFFHRFQWIILAYESFREIPDMVDYRILGIRFRYCTVWYADISAVCK